MEALKVLIADDEPKIRRGLKNSINWHELGMEVVGEAEDGEIALQMAKDLMPDIMLVDICMPFLNGLELIDCLRDILPGCLVIVVTGHDEFAFAQQAIKLKVFDYLLKPIVKNQFNDVMEKAKEALTNCRLKDKYMQWANQQLKKNLPYLKERFLNEWVNGQLTEVEVEEQLEFLGQEVSEDCGMIVIKVAEKCGNTELSREWDRQLLLFAVQNIIGELLLEWTPNAVFRDNKDNIVAITPVKQASEWNSLGERLSSQVEMYLKQAVLVFQKRIAGGPAGIPCAYRELKEEISKEENWSPIVMLSKKLIDNSYAKENLSLQEVADELNISPAYLSRLLRQELGASFIDYLTQVRIKKAIQLLNDPFIKMYEVAERVGYSSQHYFSTAFKKMTGVSPVEFRKGGTK